MWGSWWGREVNLSFPQTFFPVHGVQTASSGSYPLLSSVLGTSLGNSDPKLPTKCCVLLPAQGREGTALACSRMPRGMCPIPTRSCTQALLRLEGRWQQMLWAALPSRLGCQQAQGGAGERKPVEPKWQRARPGSVGRWSRRQLWATPSEAPSPCACSISPPEFIDRAQIQAISLGGWTEPSNLTSLNLIFLRLSFQDRSYIVLNPKWKSSWAWSPVELYWLYAPEAGPQMAIMLVW